MTRIDCSGEHAVDDGTLCWLRAVSTVSRSTFVANHAKNESSRLFLHDPQPDEIRLSPASLHLNHRFQGFDGEGVPSPVRRHGHAAAVRVPIPLMRPSLAYEIEAVAVQGGDDFSGGDRPDAAIVDVHALHGDGDAGFLLGDLDDLH